VGAIILEGKTIRYNNWRQENMPVDGPSYLVGRTDKKVLTMFCSGTNYQCLWTGPYTRCTWAGGLEELFSTVLERFLQPIHCVCTLVQELGW
jgi:hypothetical protein